MVEAVQWSIQAKIGSMVTVVKLNPHSEIKIQDQGEIIEHAPHRVVIQAYWRHPAKDLGYTRFEPGDCFTEYYYTDRWFNIFDIRAGDGVRKGWYCNIAEPAVISHDHIKQIDLLLDVWVNPSGEPHILDEDEFDADTTLSDTQRLGAQAGLHALLQFIEARQETFASIAQS
jgi:protein associated with RNAse G/E